MKFLSSIILNLFLLIVWGCSDSGDPITSTEESNIQPIVDDCGIQNGDNSSCVNYSTEIQPIFNSNCTSCHGTAGG